MKTKPKNTPFRANNPVFMLLWMAVHAALWFMTILLIHEHPTYFSSLFHAILLVLGGPGMAAAAAQIVLVERCLHRPMRGWFWITLVGQAISFFAYFATYGRPVNVMLALMLPSAILQAIWLGRHVRGAWLWVLAVGIGAILFAQYFQGSSSYPPSVILPTCLQSLITAAAMRYLWLNEREKVGQAKIKHRAAELNAGSA